MDEYVAAFASRFAAMGRPAVGVPGVHGALASADHPFGRLLITDDRAYEELAALLPAVRAGTIDVFPAAARCTQLVEDLTGWKRSAPTAMICRDLRDVPEVVLPDELALHRVPRLPGDPPDGVPLLDAVALAVTADQPALAAYLRSLAPAFRLLAAADVDGSVRATSGYAVFDARATVIFVNTHPGWRRRGVGQAMTAAALRAARASGARQACLDASDAGASIYLRLGFEIVARMTRFSGPG